MGLRVTESILPLKMRINILLKNLLDHHTNRSDTIDRLVLLIKESTPVNIQLDSLKSRRLSCGLSLRDVAKATGISHGNLNKLENGKITSPSYHTVVTLNEFYSHESF